MLVVRQLYAAANEQKRTQLLVAFIKTNYKENNPPGQQYFFKGQPMCAVAVCILYGCGKAKLEGACQLTNAGGLIPVHGSTGAK